MHAAARHGTPSLTSLLKDGTLCDVSYDLVKVTPFHFLMN